MSFDRVLPRPLALYDDPTSRLHRQTSSLLEHKIMNDRNRAIPLQDISFPSGEAQRAKEPDSCSTALSQMQLSAVNRDQIGQNGQLSATFPAPSSRQNTPMLVTVEQANADRSGSGSPTRPESAREAASQFCLCQPDPKIPRPRNGKYSAQTRTSCIELIRY
jgi:HMG box factor, other